MDNVGINWDCDNGGFYLQATRELIAGGQIRQGDCLAMEKTEKSPPYRVVKIDPVPKPGMVAWESARPDECVRVEFRFYQESDQIAQLEKIGVVYQREIENNHFRIQHLERAVGVPPMPMVALSDAAPGELFSVEFRYYGKR